MKLWQPSRKLYVPGRKPVRWLDRDRDRDRDGMNRPASGGGGGGGSEAQLNAILETYTLRLDPIEANITKDENDLISALVSTGTVAGTWVQATEGNKPLWEADGGNGKPCVTLQAAARRLIRTPNASYNTYFSTAEMFGFWVGTTSSIATGTGWLAEAPRSRLVWFRANNRFTVRHNDGSLNTAQGPIIEVDKRYIVAYRHLNGNIAISLNGGAWTEEESGDTSGPDESDLWAVGYGAGASNPGKTFQLAGRPSYPGDEDYAALVALLAEVYSVEV